MTYRIEHGSTGMVSPKLEKQIHVIHALVGNAVTKGRYIVLGTDSMQLINAAIDNFLHYNLQTWHKWQLCHKMRVTKGRQNYSARQTICGRES
ncbi:hypothetical protein SUGI_0919550 [Cryptomeria japonica]|nr:hypothetical protein SUGI_0919550 [Cryptomeria japonica]